MTFSCVMHFFNEGLILADWLDFHSKIFDYGVLINHHSTDNSLDIVKEKMPNHWKLIDSKLSDFNAAANDLEVMEVEETLPPGWKMALNVTEYLFTPNIKEKLAELGAKYPTAGAFGSRCVQIVDKCEDLPTERPIWKNRTNGFINYDSEGIAVRRHRYIHRSIHGHYELGRHKTRLHHIDSSELLHLHLSYSPWPQCIDRKLAIQTRIPDSDKNRRLGFEHLVDRDGLEKARNDHLKLSYNLLDKPLFKQYYDELLRLY